MIRGLDRAIAAGASTLVVALLATVSAGAITRTLGSPLIWTDELSRFLMVWIAVFGWVLATRGRHHVRIRFFHDLLGRRSHAGVELVIQCALVAFGVLVAWHGVTLVARNRDLEATTLPLSMLWMYLPMVIAGIVTALQGAFDAVAVVRGPPPAVASERPQPRPAG